MQFCIGSTGLFGGVKVWQSQSHGSEQVNIPNGVSMFCASRHNTAFTGMPQYNCRICTGTERICLGCPGASKLKLAGKSEEQLLSVFISRGRRCVHSLHPRQWAYLGYFGKAVAFKKMLPYIKLDAVMITETKKKTLTQLKLFLVIMATLFIGETDRTVEVVSFYSSNHVMPLRRSLRNKLTGHRNWYGLRLNYGITRSISCCFTAVREPYLLITLKHYIHLYLVSSRIT